jgi:hypothetical protein
MKQFSTLLNSMLSQSKVSDANAKRNRIGICPLFANAKTAQGLSCWKVLKTPTSCTGIIWVAKNGIFILKFFYLFHTSA